MTLERVNYEQQSRSYFEHKTQVTVLSTPSIDNSILCALEVTAVFNRL